jgi:hypothetical protein
MAVFKRVLCKERLRQVPPQFSWVDHRLVRDRHISRCSADALALYLFLVTVADGQGLSYYADATICRMLRLGQAPLDIARGGPPDAQALGRARQELIANRLIAYQRPLYQVLALGPPWGPAPQATSSQQMQSSPPQSSPPQSSPRRPAPARRPEARPTEAAPPAPSSAEGGEVQGPQSFAEILRQFWGPPSTPLRTDPSTPLRTDKP